MSATATTATTTAPSTWPPTSVSTRASCRESREPERPAPTIRFDPGTMDAYDFFLRMGPLSNTDEKYLKHNSAYWDDTIKHTTYDEYWQSRAQAPHMKHVTPAVMWVGGWFDAEDLSGPLKLFNSLEKNGAIAPDTLVMGPWRHGGWARDRGDTLGNLNFKSNTSEFFQENIELPFFVQNLKGKGNGLKAVRGRAEFPRRTCLRRDATSGSGSTPGRRRAAAARSLYFDADGKLSWSAPAAAGLRRVSQRSQQAGALHRRTGPRHGHARGLHDLRPALRLHAARRADLRNRAARPRCHHRRADHAGAARIDQRARIRISSSS